MTRVAASLLAVLSVLPLLAGCASASVPETGTRTLIVDGHEREYRVYVPEHLAAEPSLVVFLHGGFGSASQAEKAYGWNELADREGIVVAYADGKGRAWNAGSCCGSPSRDNVDDVAFITALTSTLQAEFDIPAQRSFATGMSNGAMMAYRLACESELFNAIAPVAGTIVTPCDAPSPTSVLHIHGLDDERVRFDGEVGSTPTRVDGLPVDEAVAIWRAVDECDEPTSSVEDSVTTTAAHCPQGRAVELITIAGAGHQWPGADPGSVADPDAISTAIDATEVIWQFFAERI